MLNKDIKEAYDKIRPSDSLKQRILLNINEKEHSDNKRIWNKPLLACASIIAIIFVIYCAVGVLDNRVLIYDINGNNINKSECVIPTFDLNNVLNNGNSISPMSVRLLDNEYVSTILQLNIKKDSEIAIDNGIIYLIDENRNFNEIGKETKIDDSVVVCWGFLNTNEDFVAKMHIKSEKEENIINLKYENGTFSACVLK